MSADAAPSQTDAPRLARPGGPPPRRYRAFISYSHADTRWARWLMRRLESYRVPGRFHGRAAPIGEIGSRIAPVFRDRDELPTTSDLGETIRAALRESATLIVICSPASARSRWVEEEIRAFKRLHGESRVFAFIVAGEPKFAGAGDDCFSPALRVALGPDGELSSEPAEHVAADARPSGDGPRLAFVRLVAGLLGVGFDELRRRELQRRNRRLTFIAAGSAAGMALTLGLAVVAWQARNDAQRRQDQAEDVLAFMLGDFRGELKKVGRLDLLEKVGDKAMAYFDSLDARDLGDTALARQAKALTQIGEVRLEQKDAKLAEAGRAFFTAYQRAAALAARHPTNAEFLFERAQAEFYIGFVHWRRRMLEPAREWLIRYRDSGLALGALEPGAVRARREIISGHHNLAVLDIERGHLTSARDGLLRALDMHREFLTERPRDFQIQFRIADTLSWLGSVAERRGELNEALEHFSAQANQLEALVAADPATAHWCYKLADAKTFVAGVLAITGQLERASTELAQAHEILAPLLARDQANRRWQLLAHSIELHQITFFAETLDHHAMCSRIEAVRRAVETLAAAELKDRQVSARLLRAWILEAVFRQRAGRGDASDAAAQAIELGEASLLTDPGSETARWCAQAHLAAAQIAALRGDAATAERHGRRVLELLARELEATRDWRMLDPAVRALALVGRHEESRALRDRLAATGYRPAEPWLAPFPSETTTTTK